MGTNPNQSQHINILTYSIPCILTSLNTFLITPIKCAMFIHYIHLLYSFYMFRCHIHRHHGEIVCPLLKALCPYVVINFSFYSWCNLNMCLINHMTVSDLLNLRPALYILTQKAAILNLLAPELFFFYFSTSCI